MTEMLMGILVGVVMMFVVMVVRGQYLFQEIYQEETGYERVDGERALFKRFGENMDEGDGKHRTGTQSDQEMEDILVDIPKKIQDDPC